MVKITLKGHEISTITIRDSFQRRTVLYQNNIIGWLRKLGLTEDDVDVPLKMGLQKVQAFVSWYFDGRYLCYSYAGSTFVENLYIVSKVIELEVNAVLCGEKNKEEFILGFAEDHDILNQRKEARELLGVSTDTLDMDLINQKFKVLAKAHHPDLGGDIETFKSINNAHKMLKRELQ